MVSGIVPAHARPSRRPDAAIPRAPGVPFVVATGVRSEPPAEEPKPTFTLPTRAVLVTSALFLCGLVAVVWAYSQ